LGQVKEERERVKDVYTSSGMPQAMLHPSHFPSQYCTAIPYSILFDTDTHDKKKVTTFLE